MKCPYRINKKVTWAGGGTEPSETQEFADCYGDECPFHAPEYRHGSLVRREHCMRVHLEAGGTKMEANT